MNYRLALVVGLAAVALAFAAVSASVFVYFPATLNAAYQAPPVKFELGSNANGQDLGGNSISVTLGANQTSANITLHPTYQKTYYLGVLNITNTDTNTYYLMLKLSGTSSIGATVVVHVIDSNGDEVATVSTSNPTTGWFQIPGGASYRVDVEFQVPEGTKIVGVTDKFTLDLIISMTNTETPP